MFEKIDKNVFRREISLHNLVILNDDEISIWSSYLARLYW